MERLTISIPDKKSALVKQILKGMGVIIQNANTTTSSPYKEKLVKVSTWEEKDVEYLNDNNNAFSNFKVEEW